MFNEEFNNFFESIKDKLGIRKASFTKIFQYLDNIKGPINEYICYATTNRQKAVKKIASKCDMFFIIGSRNED